jgi:hypothetical protein
MLNLTRGNALLMAACAGAAFGLPKPLSFIEAALAQKGPEAGKGFRPFKLGKVQVVLAEATRRKLFDRVVSDKALVTGYHFPFPAVGKIVADGADYTFVPAA